MKKAVHTCQILPRQKQQQQQQQHLRTLAKGNNVV